MNFSVGTRVLTVSSINKKYANKEGTIVVVNHEKFDPERKQADKLRWRDTHTEYGVSFVISKNATAEQIKKRGADAWFLEKELIEVPN